MKLKEAIDIGRASHCITIGDVDEWITRLYNYHHIISEQDYEEYCADYDFWCDKYEQMFPKQFFVDCKIDTKENLIFV